MEPYVLSGFVFKILLVELRSILQVGLKPQCANEMSVLGVRVDFLKEHLHEAQLDNIAGLVIGRKIRKLIVEVLEGRLQH